ncbi:hypothetical protein FJY68_09545 [candidate division WOR-3 bacterium]|uniref:T9SS type A sorting domain-containing protein n=1 Tax=candidate division WOR-3 bacterium TaxID=2052148 RepID=A0A937XI63_UNCW3|nr:hypothetical protein [candidate division WOR-3 bacterium]
MNRLHLATGLILAAAIAVAEPGYTGYSGAPGTGGTCAGSCHGSGTGTIQVVGFPVAYELGQSYVISVFKQSGSSISNFNASVRVGTGSTNAGTITAGYQTATYNAGSESNGVHLSSSNRDSCTFSWQAPDTAVGDVKLYMAGIQGGKNGPNTTVILTSSPMTGVSEETQRHLGLALRLEPTVASGLVGIQFSLPAGSRASLRVVDRGGRLVARIGVPKSGQPIDWRPLDREGRRLAAGTYLVVLQSSGERLVRKLVLK